MDLVSSKGDVFTLSEEQVGKCQTLTDLLKDAQKEPVYIPDTWTAEHIDYVVKRLQHTREFPDNPEEAKGMVDIVPDDQLNFFLECRQLAEFLQIHAVTREFEWMYIKTLQAHLETVNHLTSDSPAVSELVDTIRTKFEIPQSHWPNVEPDEKRRKVESTGL